MPYSRSCTDQGATLKFHLHWQKPTKLTCPEIKYWQFYATYGLYWCTWWRIIARALDTVSH